MAEPVIVWNTRDPLGGLEPMEFEAALGRLLSGRVRAAYFFGSYGTPDFGKDSDIDLILVVDTDKPFLDRALEFHDVFDLVPALDLLVYRPEEFEKLTEEPTVGFWQSVVSSMRRFL